MSRTLTYTFTITCAGPGTADTTLVEDMIDLAMQDLIFDDEFVKALDEKEAIVIQVTPGSP